MTLLFKIIFLKQIFTLAASSGFATEIKPSFNCNKATAKIDKAICDDESLSKLDHELAIVVKAASAKDPDLKTDQKKWIQSRDKNCIKDSDIKKCVKKFYDERIQVLSSLYKINRDGTKGPLIHVENFVGRVEEKKFGTNIEGDDGVFYNIEVDSEVDSILYQSCEAGKKCKVTGWVDKSHEFKTLESAQPVD